MQRWWPMRLNRLRLLLLPLLLVSGSQSSATARGSIQYKDLTTDFARVFDRDASLTPNQRIQRFKAEFAALMPGFYSADRVKESPAEYDGLIRRALAAYPAQRAGIVRVSTQFTRLFGQAGITFERQFGSFPAGQPVYLVHSLGEMDGGTRDLNGDDVLIFGADVIASIHGKDDLAPFFHHELFHVYHKSQSNIQACDLVWCELWGEGLAVYVAQRLNPKASDSELLIASPEPIRPAIEAHKNEAVCTTISKLDSPSAADLGAMFSSGRLGPNLPPRFGYYVGYLVARDLGRTRSLRQLARLQGSTLRTLIGQSLARMASCQAKSI